MIYLFNETEKPWEISREGSKYLQISKKYDFFKEDEEKIRTYNCGIYLTSPEEDFINKIKTTVNNIGKTIDVVKICDVDTNVLFGYKDLNPFIVQSRSGNNRNVILLSLDVRDKILFDIQMDRNFIIDNSLNKNELNIVISMEANTDSYCYISLYNEKDKEITQYKIMYNQNFNLRCKKSIQKLNKLFEPVVIKIKNNRPKRPTQIVICSNDVYSKMERTMEKVVKNNLQYHNLFTYFSEENLKDLIGELKSNRYSVITLFVDSNESIERLEDKYKVILQELTSKFKAVFILLNNGSIIQYKY